MIPNSDKYRIQDENQIFYLSIYSVVGDRPEQQDSSGYEIHGNGGAVVVCDGMGGCENGKLASSIAVDGFLEAYHALGANESIFEMLCSTAYALDDKVVKISDKGPSGTTLAAVVIDKYKLYWLSVGDSRIYIKRGDSFVQITRDHNLKMVLNNAISPEQLNFSEDEMKKSDPEMLISFLGTGGLPVVDCVDSPIILKKDDEILIMSDGLYKLLSDSEILNILKNFSAGTDALNALDIKAQKVAKHSRISRDNMTLAILTIK